MTTEEAIALFDGEFWVDMSYRERAVFQLHEDKLCMPFDVFHEAMEKALGRSIWTHEFGLNREGLKAELMGDAAAPTLDDIINLIPKEKRLIVVAT